MPTKQKAIITFLADPTEIDDHSISALNHVLSRLETVFIATASQNTRLVAVAEKINVYTGPKQAGFKW